MKTMILRILCVCVDNIGDVSEADLKIDVGVFDDVHKSLSHHQKYVNLFLQIKGNMVYACNMYECVIKCNKCIIKA